VTVSVTGLLSATKERAENDAYRQLDARLHELVPDVPRGWTIPDHLKRGMVRSVSIKDVQRDYGTVYEATLTVDASPRKQAELVQTYRREETWKRLLVLGGLLVFVLFCLAALSGYIKVDEATKGYYTNRLRLATAAAVGAAGVILYEWLRS
jgi:hypothetical protein